MESSGPRPSGSARGHTARFGLWRGIAAAPAVVGSPLLLTLASRAPGRGAGLLPPARFGLWRVIAATPAVIGSLLLLTLASGALGRWAGLLLLAWAAGAALPMTRIGERITVRAACRFRSPSPVQVVALQRPWVAAL